MNLNKSKHFTPKKEDSFLLSLFLFTCFSFQTMADLVQVKFYYQQFDVFWLWLKPFLVSLCYSKWTQIRVSFYQFSEHLFWLLPNIKQKRIPLNDNIFGANTPESSKIRQKVEVCFIKFPEILIHTRDLFILSTRNFMYFPKCIPLKKKSVKLKNFLCKDKFSNNFLRSLV